MDKPEFHALSVSEKPVGTVRELATKGGAGKWYEPWCSDIDIGPTGSTLFFDKATHMVRNGHVWEIRTPQAALKKLPVNPYSEEITGRIASFELNPSEKHRGAWNVFWKIRDLRCQVELMSRALVAVGCERVVRAWMVREALALPDTVFAELAVIGIGGKKLKE